MPVTVMFSRQFQERLGEEVARELVDWFNVTAESYRQDLREFNEMSVARFDARLSERLGAFEAAVNARLLDLERRLDRVEARLDRVEARLDGVEARLDGVEARLDGVEARLDGVEARLDGIVVRLDGMDARLKDIEERLREAKLDQLDTRLEAIAARFEANMERRFGEQARWFVLAWLAQMAAIIAFGLSG